VIRPVREPGSAEQGLSDLLEEEGVPDRTRLPLEVGKTT